MYSIWNMLSNDAFDTFFTETDALQYKDGDDTILEIDAPGASSSSVEIDTREGILRVKWERKGHKKNRAFRLSKSTDESNITATVKDGVISLRLPPKPEIQLRKIPILTS